MKWLRKINKGFILTVIVLAILITYLISVEVTRNAEKPNIESACKEYIELMNKYSIIPEENQKVYDEMSLSKEEQAKLKSDINNKIESQMNKLEEELNKKMIDNEIAVDMQRKRLEEYVKSENNIFLNVITKFDRQITKIKKFVYDENQVTVTFSSKVEEEIKYLGSDEKEMTKVQNFDNPEETITLQYVDGKWKVVYADLQYNNYLANSYSTGMVVEF